MRRAASIVLVVGAVAAVSFRSLTQGLLLSPVGRERLGPAVLLAVAVALTAASLVADRAPAGRRRSDLLWLAACAWLLPEWANPAGDSPPAYPSPHEDRP